MPLFISRRRLRPLNRLASKESIIVEGIRWENGPFIEVLAPVSYKLRFPWLKDLIQIDYEFDGQQLQPGSIDDDLHDRLLERYDESRRRNAL